MKNSIFIAAFFCVSAVNAQSVDIDTMYIEPESQINSPAVINSVPSPKTDNYEAVAISSAFLSSHVTPSIYSVSFLSYVTPSIYSAFFPYYVTPHLMRRPGKTICQIIDLDCRFQPPPLLDKDML